MKLLKSKFTQKVWLLAALPIIGMLAVNIAVIYFGSSALTTDIGEITTESVDELYRSQLSQASKDISENIQLRFDHLQSELRIFADATQTLIDQDNALSSVADNLQSLPFYKNQFQYNQKGHWSNTVEGPANISISVWGYQHDKNGNINPQTLDYASKMAFLKPLLKAMGNKGANKGWLYLVGPKVNPLIMATPWSEAPAMMDKKYPDHNTNNFWDFFFPGMIENWQKWIDAPDVRKNLVDDMITLTPMYEDAAGAGLMVTFFHPLWTNDRTHNYGAVAVDFNIDHLINLVAEQQVGQSGFSFLLQKDGSVLGLDQEKLKLLGLSEQHDKGSGVAYASYKLGNSVFENIANIPKPGETFKIFSVNTDSEEYLLAFQKVVDFNTWNGETIDKEHLHLVLAIPKKEVLSIPVRLASQIESTMVTAVGGSILISLVLGGIGFFIISYFTHRETRQVRLLSNALQTIQKSNQAVQVEVVSRDELGDLATTFNDIWNQIHMANIKLQEYSDELETKVADRTKHLESALREIQFQKYALDQHAIVFMTDIEDTIIYSNERLKLISGYSNEELSGKNPTIFTSGVMDPAFHQSIWKTITNGQVWEGEMCAKTKDGDLYWVNSTIVPFIDETEKITRYIYIQQDITERKRMEQEVLTAKEKAEDATRAKSEFLANMSHEIRTPMNAVIGMAHLALKTDLTPKQRDYLNKIQSSSNSLLGIINDILDYSKIEAGKLDMETVEFDLSKTLDNVANVISVKAKEKENLEVLFNLDTKVPNFLVGDPLRLNQILVNFGNNAIKFTEQGEIVLTTKIIEKSEDEVTLQFSMRDTGIGMSEQQQAKLFQAFSQADTSTTRKYGGTGLGLTICKRLVNMMGGEIGVESEPGEGTSFSFTANFGLGKERVERRFVPLPDLNRLKVLVADDNATSRNILQDILESFSFEVYLSASGKEAIEEIERADKGEPFRLVVMDWKMPGMDGLEASYRIKTHKALNNIPSIILVTAYGKEGLMRQADEIGLEGFLLKPVSSSMLFDSVMHAMGKGDKDQSVISREKDKQPEEFKAIAGAKVLLVEDNEINQQVAKEILEGAGLVVTVANDGKEAVSMVKSLIFDVVLMDIQMPVMDGYTASREIRNLESEIRNVPIIAMTAHAMAGDKKKSIEAGMNDHVTKPIDPAQLFTTLQKWIKPDAKQALSQNQQPQILESQPDPDQVIPHEDELPNVLPGFDLQAGLVRLMGNKILYRKLLLDFGANYGGAASEIQEALAAGDFEQAHSLVHNLKGLAGNLEANDLHVAAVEMETLVKGQTAKTTSDKELNRKLAELENALGQALGAVQTLGSIVEKKVNESSENVRASVPPELIKKVIDRIKAAADIGDVMQIKSIAEELMSESDAVTPFCDKLVQLAEDFDFDGIQRVMLEIES